MVWDVAFFFKINKKIGVKQVAFCLMNVSGLKVWPHNRGWALINGTLFLPRWVLDKFLYEIKLHIFNPRLLSFSFKDFISNF